MNNPLPIPFLDLVTPHARLEEALISIIRDTLRTGRFIGGPAVEGFEKEFADYCGSQYCIGVGSGTDALRFALMAAGIRSGDMVITIPNTFIATTEAISQAGGYPAFVDVDERTFTLDPEKFQEFLECQCDRDDKSGLPVHRITGRRVSAVIPVHLYGQPADMDPIINLAKKYNMIVIEDACQAHGAEYFSRDENRWKKAGAMGLAAAFSFYPGKNLGACGEAGAVTTNDAMVARKIRMLRDHGQEQKYFHEIEGYNGRLDAVQAGILQIKLKYLPEWTEMRRQCASRYSELLGHIDGITLPYEPPGVKAVYHLYVIRTPRRDALHQLLTKKDIGTALHYPLPLHLQKAYSALGYKKGSFPVSEKAAGDILSLPIYPELQMDQQNKVAEAITNFVAQKGPK